MPAFIFINIYYMFFSVSIRAAPLPENCAAAVDAERETPVVDELAELVAELQVTWSQGDFSQARGLYDLVRDAARRAQAAGMSLSALPEEIARRLNISVVRQQESQVSVRNALREERMFRPWDKHHEFGPMPERPISLSASFSPDGKRLLTAHELNGLTIYDVESKIAIQTALEYEIRSAIFNPGGDKILLTSTDRKAVLGEIKSEKFIPQIPFYLGHTTVVTASAINFNETLVATAELHGQIVFWDAKQGIQQNTNNETTPYNRALSLVFGPDGKTLLAAYFDGQSRLWRVGDPVPLRTFPGSIKAVFSPDGQRVATSSNNQVIIWETDTGAHLKSLPHQGDIEDFVFSPDGRELASASSEGLIIWNSISGGRLTTLTPLPRASIKGPLISTQASKVAYSADGERIVGIFAANVVVWNRPQ